MGRKNYNRSDIPSQRGIGQKISRGMALSAQDRSRIRDISIRLQLVTEALTRKDIRTWRNAWQWAINVDNPNRNRLYNIYTDESVDLHLQGCIAQRKGFVLNKSFKLCDKSEKENRDITEIFEAPWFKTFMDLALDSIYWGHSLIELGPVTEVEGRMTYSYVSLVPRHHVIPEKGVIVVHENDVWQSGFDYRNSELSQYCIEAGGTHDLGLMLGCAPQTISKKNMMAFWDTFGEIFGMPLRVATTTSRDQRDLDRIENMLQNMGAAAYGLFPEGTTIDMKESNRTDSFNVYDKRIERCNSEISKGILTVTMTMEDGASLSQSQVHKSMLDNLVNKDADFIRDLVNWKLIPLMISNGFPIKGYRFYWDEGVDYTPEDMVNYERMVMEHYEVDPQYFIDKYNMPVVGKRGDNSDTSAVTPQGNDQKGRKGNKEEKLFFD